MQEFDTQVDTTADDWLYAAQSGSWTVITVSGLSPGGLQAEITVGTTPVELKVGASRLALRTNATAMSMDANDVYWGYNSSVTTSSGTQMFKSQFLSWDFVTDTTTIFLVASVTNRKVRVTESP